MSSFVPLNFLLTLVGGTKRVNAAGETFTGKIHFEWLSEANAAHMPAGSSRFELPCPEGHRISNPTQWPDYATAAYPEEKKVYLNYF